MTASPYCRTIRKYCILFVEVTPTWLINSSVLFLTNATLLKHFLVHIVLVSFSHTAFNSDGFNLYFERFWQKAFALPQHSCTAVNIQCHLMQSIYLSLEEMMFWNEVIDFACGLWRIWIIMAVSGGRAGPCLLNIASVLSQFVVCVCVCGRGERMSS